VPGVWWPKTGSTGGRRTPFGVPAVVAVDSTPHVEEGDMTVIGRSHGRVAGTVALAGTLVLGSCSTLVATKIAEIKTAPSSYDGKTVTIAGKVTSTHNLLVIRYYDVDDGTGVIPVVTESELPKEGDTVRVKGKVNEAFAVGSAHLVVIVEEPPKR
jgi:hypothetical protein